MSIKIFSIYHKKAEMFKSDVVEPIQTGCNFTDLDLGVLKDNTEDNIADKNPYYGEMTAWYWVWKNYLKKNPEIEYVGFCHYRRFLNFQENEDKQPFSSRVSIKTLKKNFNKLYSNEKIFPFIKDYDIILPKKYKMKKKFGTVYQQFIESHPKDELEKLISIIEQYYPEYVVDMNEFLNSKQGVFCLNFVMKRKYFEEFMEWVFDLLQKMEEISDWTQYDEYLTIRTPAYLIERFMNIWVNHKVRTQGIKVLERKSFMLCESITKIFPGVSIAREEKYTQLNIFSIKLSFKNKKLKV